MRYSLRNKEKIKAKLGAGILRKIIADLDSYFKKNTKDVISSSIQVDKKREYLHTDTYIYAIIGKKYDVLNLAFFKEKERIL